jgi:ribosomal-protein-alanine N-acetyltransferase
LPAFGFGKLKVHRIWARCLAENRSSSRVLARLGVRLEGKLRKNERFKDRWWDTLLYGMLEDEWSQHQAPPPASEIPKGG